jgi:choline dehydrogenase-like flavoprotein
MEQVPDPENRVRLAEARDEQGYPIPEIALRLTEPEVRAHQSALVLATEALGLRSGRIARQFRLMLGAGRCDFFWHHMGSTRMASDPADGVVDADCRVHGLSNLFVAGSSVFPTGGIAAPTLTIVALALRLAGLIAGRPAEAVADAAPGGGRADRDSSEG